MKNKSFVFALVSVLAFGFLGGNCVQAQEIKAPIRKCLNCNIGNLIEKTTRTFEHEERFPCTHGHKTDIYNVYEVKKLIICDTCGKTTVLSSYEDHVFVKCID